jgi:hypothetical protein
MAITLLGYNINSYGFKGSFEADRSTWGFSNNANFTFTRSGDYATQGTYSAKAKSISAGTGSRTVLSVNPYPLSGLIAKKYIAYASVRTTALNPVAKNAAIIKISAPSAAVTIEQITTTVNDCKADFVQISVKFNSYNTYEQIAITVETTTGLIVDGLLYIDDFKLFEYEDVVEDPPEDPLPSVLEKIYHVKNPITLSKAATAGWDALTNFRCFDDVRVEMEAGTDLFTSKLKIDLVPDSDGNVTFQVSEAFRGVLTAAPPDEAEDALVQLTDRIKKFRHFTGEISGTETEPNEEDLTPSALYMAMMGGLSKLQFPTQGQGGFFSTYLPINKKFLTWAPTTKEVDNNQEDYLTFFIYSDEIVQMQVRIKAYYDDGTNETDIIHTQEVSFAQLWQIPSGTSNSGVKLINPAKNVIKYELSLLNQSDALISEVRTYTIDKINLPLRRFFLFLNSLGSFEVLRFYGATATEANISKTNVVKFLPYNYEQLDGERTVNFATVQKITEHSTGYLKTLGADWLAYMEDFLLSKQVYDITNGTRKPIAIEGGSFLVNEDRNYERYVRFKALNSYQDEVYTPNEI